MSSNPIEENSTPKTTGSLEELFRHHLGDEAAVPPRAMLWDQIDNSLLVRQNEVYRRRLAATRWVAAASLLLATLAGTGWWARRDTNLGAPGVAVVSPMRGIGTTTGRIGTPQSNNGGLEDVRNGQPSEPAAVAGGNFRDGSTAATSSAQPNANAATAAVRNSQFAPASMQQEPENELARLNSRAQPSRVKTATGAAGMAGSMASAARATAVAMTRGQARVAAASEQRALGMTLSATGQNARAAGTVATGAPAAAATAPALAGASSSLVADAAVTAPVGAGMGMSSVATVVPEQVGLLSARFSALALSDAAGLPNGLVTLPMTAEPVAVVPKRWTYSASYTAGLFSPNINFSRAGSAPEYDYNPALGTDSPKMTEEAAAEYRQHLRPGLSQRIALLATRHLPGHWSLNTGVEFTQASAQSASTKAFVGEQLPDLGLARTTYLRNTNFRYRMASIPMEVRYSNPVKKGWSLYGRLGGAVTALLGVRNEVEGYPEATRTYSIASVGTPYRRVTGSVRGAAGAQFRTNTGKWAFTVGPMAEIGLLSLNAHPVQDFTSQSRPYSFGMEAGIEFGR